MNNFLAKTFKAFLVIVAWGVCCARYVSLFDDKLIFLIQCASQGGLSEQVDRYEY